MKELLKSLLMAIKKFWNCISIKKEYVIVNVTVHVSDSQKEEVEVKVNVEMTKDELISSIAAIEALVKVKSFKAMEPEP